MGRWKDLAMEMEEKMSEEELRERDQERMWGSNDYEPQDIDDVPS